jgi:hypothetical protein
MKQINNYSAYIFLNLLIILLLTACDDKKEIEIYEDRGTKTAPLLIMSVGDSTGEASQVVDVSYYRFTVDSSGIFRITVNPTDLKFIDWTLFSDSDFSGGLLQTCDKYNVDDPVQDCTADLKAATNYYLRVEYWGEYGDDATDAIGTLINITILYEGPANPT